jgi:hypothetical protein
VHNGIWDANDLRAFKDSVEKGSWNYWKDENGVVNLRDNIDMSSATLEAIGTIDDDNMNIFSGTFDGNGHKIYNVHFKENSVMAKEDLYASALFALTMNASIQNLRVEATVNSNGTPTNTHDGALAEGGIIGMAIGVTSLKNCSFSGSIGSNNANTPMEAGGLIGSVSTMPTITMENCYVNNTEIKGEKVGGLVGYVSYDKNVDTLTFTACHVVNTNIKTSDAGKYAGGLLGGIIGDKHFTANINSCYVTETAENLGKVSISSAKVAGGLLGFSYVDVKLTGCFNSVWLNGTTSNAALIGGADGAPEAYGCYGIFSDSATPILLGPDSGGDSQSLNDSNNGVFTGSSASDALRNFYGGSALNDLNAALIGSGYQYKAPDDKASYPVLIKQ